MDTLKCIKTRRSVRAYTDKPITDADLREVIDCVRMTPSSRNKQQWKFYVVTNRAVLNDFSKNVANGQFLKSAQACVVVCGLTENHRLAEDCGAAMQTLLLAAHAKGIGGCWIAGLGKEHSLYVKEKLGIDEEYTIFSIASLGYPKVVPATPPKKEIEEISEWIV